MSNSMLATASPATLVSVMALTLVCLVAGWFDLWYRRIPNWICAITAIAGLLTALIMQGPALAGSNLLHGLAALICGMILFRLGVLGGGDVKFYSSIAAWFSLAKAPTLLMMVALCGLALLILWFIYRRAAGYRIVMKSSTPFDGLPYGIAIGAGALVTFAL